MSMPRARAAADHDGADSAFGVVDPSEQSRRRCVGRAVAGRATRDRVAKAVEHLLSSRSRVPRSLGGGPPAGRRRAIWRAPVSSFSQSIFRPARVLDLRSYLSSRTR